MKGRAITIGAVGMALLASAAACFLLSQWPKVYSSPTDLDITTNTTWTGDQIIYGTLTVKAGKTLTIDSSAAGSAPITITATNLIVESTAAITANGKGSAGGAATSDGAGTGKGLAGSASKSGGGAGYGGAGGDGAGNAGSGGAAYGDNSLPINNGSGGGGGASTAGGAGGGAIKFIVSGTTTLNGPVSVNGADGTGDTNGSGGGSGGSIYLDTNVLTGSGNISANGGSAVNGSGGAGGGGRVAVYYNSNSGYSGTVSTDKGATGSGTAAGGTTLPGGLFTGGTSGTGPMGVFPNGLFTGGTSGTGPMGIGYYSASSTAFVWSGEGSDNSDSTVANWQGGVVPTTAGSVIFCELSSKNCTWDITASMLDFTLDSGYTGTVTLASTLTTTSAFTLTQGAFNAATYNLTVGGNFTRSGLASFTPGTSTVILNSVGTSSVYGDNTFYNLTSTAAGKTINFEATKTVTVTNNLSLAGTGTGVNLLTLNSTTAGTAANLNVAGTATGMNYLSVKDSNVSGKTIVAYNSTNVSGNTNWIFGSAGTVYWTNSSGNGLWSNAANWSTGAVPISTDSVIFNTASTTNCSFDTGVANTTVANLTLDTGYTGTLTLAQGIIVSGTITINAGTINDGGQTVNLTNMAYTAGTITSSGTWKAVANGTISSWGSSGVNNFEVATGKNSAIANSITMRIKNQVVQRGNSIITIGSGSYLWYISAAATDPIYQESGATVSGGTINFGGITSAISQRAFTTTGDFAVSQTTATFTATGAWDIGGKFYNSTNSTYTAAFNFGANTIKVAGDFDLRGMALNPGTSTLQITGANSLTSNMYGKT